MVVMKSHSIYEGGCEIRTRRHRFESGLRVPSSLSFQVKYICFVPPYKISNIAIVLVIQSLSAANFLSAGARGLRTLSLQTYKNDTTFYNSITRTVRLYNDLTADADAGVDVDVFVCRPTAFKRSIYDVLFR
ncbi:hypothetical protein EVAR_44751_1 [Eumeta japonica]|uniref:Uncharacterized protein n=1 Tax=Eumeta variegata TaxID=151549 RepID=A0A4C1XF03_EUMVA|nr:hypothetical protein EVAR_44751_1 [Eumeta japonica]